MVFVYDENVNVIDEQIKNTVESEIKKVLKSNFDVHTGYLETIKFVTQDFFDSNVAALVEPKNKIIYLNYESFAQVFERKLTDSSDEYCNVINSLLHEYIHLINHYEDLLVCSQYVENMDVSKSVKCSIITLVDEYFATYRSGEKLFSKNEINKILPSMCKYISQYKGKRESPLYWQVISNLGIGIAYDTLVLKQQGVSQYCIDVDHEEVIPYKNLILRIRYCLIEFYSSGKLQLLDDLRLCVEELCEIFGMDKQFLKDIDEYKRT